MRSRINSADGLTDGRRYRAYAQYPSVPLLPDRRVRIRGTLTDDTVLALRARQPLSQLRLRERPAGRSPDHAPGRS